MTTTLKIVMAGTCALALTACGDRNYATTWNQEAGAFLDEGAFGDPTMQNMMAQMCTGQAKGYIVPDPIVALHPTSTAENPVYFRGHVMCSGQLNGKYAQVIFREYVTSATSPSRMGGGLRAIDRGGE
jgi:hypothetical protein